MKLSILIPTHNRPNLFWRCLDSVRPMLADDVEIIVNNDSNDIVPKDYHPNVSYYFNKFDNLSKVYEFLLSKSTGKYVYFLEDDDYLNDSFYSIPLEGDIIAGNYCPTYETPNKLEFMRLFKDGIVNANHFANILNFEHLQLGQFIFKRDVIKDFVFPMDSNVHNDIKLVLHAARNSEHVHTTSKVFYYQTIDGGDNISFSSTVPSIPVTQSMDFLNESN